MKKGLLGFLLILLVNILTGCDWNRALECSMEVDTVLLDFHTTIDQEVIFRRRRSVEVNEVTTMIFTNEELAQLTYAEIIRIDDPGYYVLDGNRIIASRTIILSADEAQTRNQVKRDLEEKGMVCR